MSNSKKKKPNQTDKTKAEVTDNQEDLLGCSDEPSIDGDGKEENTGTIESSDDSTEVKDEDLKTQLANGQEELLRARAEIQNINNRAIQQVEKAHKFALDKISNDLLPVVDNLERALQAFVQVSDESETIVAMREGIELTLKSFMDVLSKHNIEAIDPHGEPFDPDAHQAVGTIPSSDMEPNSIANVLQKGYTLNKRLIRPALVMVSS